MDSKEFEFSFHVIWISVDFWRELFDSLFKITVIRHFK